MPLVRVSSLPWLLCSGNWRERSKLFLIRVDETHIWGDNNRRNAAEKEKTMADADCCEQRTRFWQRMDEFDRELTDLLAIARVHFKGQPIEEGLQSAFDALIGDEELVLHMECE